MERIAENRVGKEGLKKLSMDLGKAQKEAMIHVYDSYGFTCSEISEMTRVPESVIRNILLKK